MILLNAYSFSDFSNYAKNYNVNVYKQSRMVHKRNGCYYSKLYQFIPFDTLEEIKQFEKIHDIQFTYCKNQKCGFNK